MQYKIFGGMEQGIHYTRFMDKVVADSKRFEEKPKVKKNPKEGTQK